jgi:hypothetical protein
VNCELVHGGILGGVSGETQAKTLARLKIGRGKGKGQIPRYPPLVDRHAVELLCPRFELRGHSPLLAKIEPQNVVNASTDVIVCSRSGGAFVYLRSTMTSPPWRSTLFASSASLSINDVANPKFAFMSSRSVMSSSRFVISTPVSYYALANL